MEALKNSSLLDRVGGRGDLAGSNKFELLLFSLGGQEIFGINVFKIREVCNTPAITKVPNMPEGMEGVINLRGSIVPVLNLAKFVGYEVTPTYGQTMIMTECSSCVQGFIVQDVDRIIRVDWGKVRPPDGLMGNEDSLITATIELEERKLVSVIDIEKILVAAFGEIVVPEIDPAHTDKEVAMFFVDDSNVVRKKIAEVIEQLGVKYYQANRGTEAWNSLQAMANRAQENGEKLSEHLKVILLDAEMPEMDGYVLTQYIKSDKRFSDIPVVMHSSTSSDTGRSIGKQVGVDFYVAKFDPLRLADTLRPLLESKG